MKTTLRAYLVMVCKVLGSNRLAASLALAKYAFTQRAFFRALNARFGFARPSHPTPLARANNDRKVATRFGSVAAVRKEPFCFLVGAAPHVVDVVVQEPEVD